MTPEALAFVGLVNCAAYRTDLCLGSGFNGKDGIFGAFVTANYVANLKWIDGGCVGAGKYHGVNLVAAVNKHFKNVYKYDLPAGVGGGLDYTVVFNRYYLACISFVKKKPPRFFCEEWNS